MKKTHNPESIVRWITAACIAVTTWGTAVVAPAQDVMQLTVPADHYTLGRFRYEAPKVDGWRQIANEKDSLTLIYAEQKDAEAIDTKFGVTLEAHDIPEGINVESAAALADLSRKQISEARKDEIVGFSPIEAVPSIDNLYTYRLLVHAPVKEAPDAYEVYYVAMAPDKTQYVVVQCITKTAEYGNELYFNQFYGSLASLKYEGGKGTAAVSTKTEATAPKAAAPKTAEAKKPAAEQPPKSAGH